MSENKKFEGNTLDYYNDNLTKKAVEDLFDDYDKSQNSNQSEKNSISRDKNTKYSLDNEEVYSGLIRNGSNKYKKELDYNQELYEKQPEKKRTKKKSRSKKSKKRKRSASKNQTVSPNSITKLVIIMCVIFLLIFIILIQNIRIMEKQISAVHKQNFLLESTNKVLETETLFLKQSIAMSNQNSNNLSQPEPLQEEVTTDNIVNPELQINESSALPQEYVVKNGDNLSKISRKFYGDESGADEISEANNLSTEDLYVGQKLVIPKI